MRHVIAALCLAVLICALTKPASAQSLSLSANALNFQLGPDPTPEQPLNITTAWQSASSNQLRVCLYMVDPLLGSSPNTDTIPASSVQVNRVALGVGNGKPQCGVHGAMLVSSTTINLWGTRTDTLAVRIAGYSATLTPDTYTGAINVVAITY